MLITGCSSGIGLGLAARLAADAARRFKGNGVDAAPGVQQPRVVCGLGQAAPQQGETEPGGGLGLVLAVQPAGTAAHGHALSPVYATMRDLAKGERLLERLGGCCPDTLEVLQLDVTDPCSLAAAAQRVQGQRLDVLGMALPGAPGVPGVAEGTSLGSQPSPGHRGQMPNHGRCRQS